jgi:xanthine dehydrogenase molybdenum-binding subunit
MDFTLNGRPVSVDIVPGESLLHVLREQLGLRSLKDGCSPEGSCGACTVIVDGHAVVSCARPAERAEGRAVETVDGLPADMRSLWADAFVATGASQCGYCSPGIVMKAEALLRREAAPGREAVAKALAGNLCRCTGYASIIDAVELAAAVRRGEAGTPASAARAMAGARYEGRELALGDKPFIGDLVAPAILHGALRFADVPRALVRRIDIAAALAVPGVVAVLTAADVPGRREQGLIAQDWPLLVAEGEVVRYVGDVLAAVAAETREAAVAAAALVELDLEPLPAVTDPFDALADGAPAVHEAGNLLSLSVVRRGDADEALAGAAHVASASFRTQSIEHAFLEPEAALAVPYGATGPDGLPVTAYRVHVYSPGQGAWEDRRQVASLLGVPAPAVLVTQVSTGGAFGGKEDLSVQGQAALLAVSTGRPVLLKLSRRESMRFHVKRHPMWLDYTAGCDAEGRLVAVRARIVGDNGAYTSVGGKVLERAAGHACGPYRVPNVDVEARAVFTNNPPSGAMRGFGANQAAFGMEGVLDMLAEQVGIDGWEIRWRNALDVGDRCTTGQRLGEGVGVRATLLAVKDAYRAARYAGIACGIKNVGVGNGLAERGRAVLRPEADGSVTLFHSWTEMGQGCHTVFRDLVAADLGIAPDRITVLVDTTHELDTGETTSSRATMLGGRAVLRACESLRAALGTGRLSDLAGREFAGELVVDWTTRLEAGVDEPVTHFAYGWASQVVILDDEGRVERIVAAHDVGRALNPVLLKGQVEGGVHMGLGMALTEAFETADGVPVTDTLKSLGIIPAAAMPPVEVILVEVPQPEGPHGAKGMGEAVLVPTAAAVAGALHAFDGVRRTRLPMRDSPAARALLPRLAREAAERGTGAATGMTTEPATGSTAGGPS